MTGRNFLFVFAAVLLLGGFGYWMLAPGGPAPSDDDFTHRPMVSPELDEGLAEGTRTSDTRPIETSLYAGQDDPDLDKEPAAAEDSLRFVLVQDASGKPVGGAEVALVPLDRNRGRGGAMWRNDGARDQRPPFRTVKSGPDGFALLSPLPARRFQIEARTDGNYGSADFDQGAANDAESPEAPPGADAVIVLEPVKRLLVRVVDSGGAPVPELLVRAMPDVERTEGFQVINGDGLRTEIVQGLVFQTQGMRGRPNPAVFRNAFHSEWTSDPDGFAVFEINNTSGLYDAERVRIDAILLGREPVSQIVPMAGAGTTEAAIEVPQTIRLAVSLVERGGEAFTSSATVYWTIHSDEPPAAASGGWVSGFAGTNRSRTGNRQLPAGEATLSGFPANTKVTFIVRAPNRIEAGSEFSLGQDLSQAVTLEVGDLVPTISVTLVDIANEPIRNTEVQVALSWEDDASASSAQRPGSLRAGRSTRTATTNSDGELRLNGRTRATGILQILPPGAAFQAFEAMARGAGMRGGPPRRTAADPMAQVSIGVLEGGEHRDLGSLQVDDTFILVSGRVVDHEGNPVRNADVAVQAAPRVEPGRNTGITFQRFRNAITVKSDSQGMFRVFGIREPTLDYAVSASTNRSRSRTTNFSPGARGVVISLELTGSLTGRIRQADSDARGRLSVWLSPAGAEPDAQRTTVQVRPDGTFHARNLDAGIYDLTIQINGHTDAVIPGIEIRGGETAAPAILSDYVAGQSMARVLVMVSDQYGAPVHRATVEFTSIESGVERGRGRNSISTRTDDLGRAETLIPANQPVRVRVRSSDYRTFEAETANFPLSVTLAPSPKIILEFPPLPEVEGVRRYSISLMPQAAEGGSESPQPGRGGRPRRDSSALPGETSVSFTNVEAGTYAILVYAELTAGGRVNAQLGVGGMFRLSGGRVGPVSAGIIEWADQRDRTIPVMADLRSAVQALLDARR